MSVDYRIVAVTLTAVFALSPHPAAQQPAHQGHDMKQTAAPVMTDADFTMMMTEHHQGAIAMCKIEESRGSRDAVKALAAKMRETQEREVEAMAAGPAAHADMPTTAPDAKGSAAHGGHGATMQQHHQMMQQEAMASRKRLENASGAAVDTAFLEEMTKHHQAALEMISKAKLRDPGLRRLSQKMAADQKREIREFKKLQAQ